jgi:hypothetical protein
VHLSGYVVINPTFLVKECKNNIEVSKESKGMKKFGRLISQVKPLIMVLN